MPSPNDHLRTLVELLRPSTADLARRWVAALALVPIDEREAVVEAVERRITSEYAPSEERLVRLVEPPVQKDGYIEQTIRTFEVLPAASPDSKLNTKRAT